LFAFDFVTKAEPIKRDFVDDYMKSFCHCIQANFEHGWREVLI
jgi:hypothetical protein